jgi:hypothetical protein
MQIKAPTTKLINAKSGLVCCPVHPLPKMKERDVANVACKQLKAKKKISF